MKVSIRWKFLATYLYLVGLSIALLGGYLARQWGREQLTQLRISLARQAKLVAAAEADLFAGFKEEGPGDAQLTKLAAARCREAARLSRTRVTFILPDGVVVADSEAQAETMENHATRPEVTAALEGVTGFADRLSHTVGRRFLYVAVPVNPQGKGPPLGITRLALPLSQVERTVANVRRVTVLTIGLLLLLAVPVGMVWSRRLTAPLRRMAAMTRRVGEGDLTASVHWESADEIGELAAGLNQMVARLRTTYAELEEQNRTFETVLARLRAGVIIADAKGNLILANGAASSLLGLELQSALGRPFISGSLHYELDQAMRQCLQQGKPVQLDAVVDRQSGRTVEAMFAPANDDSGQVTLVVGVLHDITERIRTTEMRREFVANASHELRTPAASIRAMTETLLAGGKEDPERLDRTLGYLLSESERLSRLISDLLDLAKAESSAGPGRTPVNIHDVAVQVMCRIADRARAKEITLSLEVDEGLVVRSAPGRLEEVLLNLLENAVNYTPEGGNVRLDANAEDGEVVVAIHDTGIGIAEEHLTKVFERFYRIDKDRSRATGGTGLGLAIVKHLVANDGGEISVKSRVGVGTTFTVRYPQAPPGQPTIP